MEFKFYIIKDGTKKEVTPEPEEIRNAKADARWGMKKGIISLVNPIRTSTTYWEVI